ncbi:hypothetical protein J4Q44_G00290040 [Coregonus suidteri]|uniref:Ig-like domain-containing protein n=1 Tax=Coregonus suidteri TaxID=861788 RepID=A0AAN8QJ84_9TELE
MLLSTIALQVVTPLHWSKRKSLTCSTTCPLTGNPTYTWYKNGQHLDESTYKVKYSVSSNYEDSYSCAVKGHEDLHSPAVCLQVKVIPAAEGQRTLTCSTTCTLTNNPNPTYIWYKNGQNVQEDSSPMYSISSEDADSYFCTVKDHEGLSSPAVYKPKTSVTVSPSGEIVEGSSVTLTCSSDANPPVQSYTWWYKKNGGGYQSMTGPQHVFNQIQSSDTGEYYCEVQNEMGTDRSRTINMDVKYGPKNPSMSVSPSGEIVEGSSVTLTCSSDANPPVDKYTWYKKNGASLTGSENTYNFTTISSEDSGEYYCEAENKYGRLNSSSVSVDVQYGPKNTSVSVSPSGEIVEGSSVTLTCSSDANPPVDKYTWETLVQYMTTSQAWIMTPTAVQTAATVDQDDVHYASVHFSRSKIQEVPLYSTVQLPQPQKQDEDVQYAAVKFNRPSAATPPAAAQAAEEDSSVIYSRVNYPEPRRPENKSDKTPVYLDLYSPTK